MDIKEYCKQADITLKAFSEALGMRYNYFISCVHNFNGKKFTLENARAIYDLTEGLVTIDDVIPKSVPKKKREEEMLSRIEKLENRVAVLEKKEGG
jgi:hypothetical protein